MEFLSILTIIIFTILIIIFYPLINWVMTQFVFKSEKRTRKILQEAYDFYKKEYPNASEGEILTDVMRAAFSTLDSRRMKWKPKQSLANEDIARIVNEVNNIEELTKIVVERGLSPDTAPWF